MNLAELIAAKWYEILALADKYGATDGRVFGSVAKGTAGPASDLDLLVKLAADRSLLDLAALTQDLQDLLGCKVEVVSEDGLYWLLRWRILREARPL